MNYLKKVRLILWAACVIAILALVGVWLIQKQGPSVVWTQSSESLDIGGPFELTDQFGKTRSSQEFRGKFMVVYFGYTFCPDICPAGLANLTMAFEKLGTLKRFFQTVFITIDPERDTVAELKLFSKHFDKSFVYLTGSQEKIDQAIKAYRVYARKNIQTDSAANYLMDHSSLIYIMAPDGRYLAHFDHNTDPSKMAELLRRWVG